ncbi:hypothetical protein CFP56_035048 [Quercus suber]|uniref:DUF7705 domain-containing protein n=1 Tax=Quercus suber TaxID=58331 RepID=A0AAW0JAD4_QUESU
MPHRQVHISHRRPRMKSPDVRVGLEAWNFCNEVGMEAPNMGSPGWLIVLTCGHSIMRHVPSVRRQIKVDETCSLCNEYQETTLHILWLCDHAKAVWQSVLCFAKLYQRNFRSFMDVVEAVMEQRPAFTVAFFSTIAWSLWERRNRIRENQPSWPLHEIGNRIKEMVVDSCLIRQVHISHRRPRYEEPRCESWIEVWNFCNEVGMEAPNMGSPRLADCVDLCCPLIIGINICMLLTHSSYRYLFTKLANLSSLLTINANFMLEYIKID